MLVPSCIWGNIMKINPIKSFAFKANNFNEDNILGYDDEISQSRRNYNAFNPKCSRELEFWDFNKVNCLRNLYDKLTACDKKLMGWTKEFDANFLPKLEVADKKLSEKLLKEAQRLF